MQSQPNISLIQQNIPLVKIDDEGVFKYILIRMQSGEFECNFVRGARKYEYHLENLKAFQEELKKSIKFNKFTSYLEQGVLKTTLDDTDIKFECIGGGRIDHSISEKRLSIYGYSQSYGQADHKIAMTLLRQVYIYPEERYKTSNEGY